MSTKRYLTKYFGGFKIFYNLNSDFVWFIQYGFNKDRLRKAEMNNIFWFNTIKLFYEIKYVQNKWLIVRTTLINYKFKKFKYFVK